MNSLRALKSSMDPKPLTNGSNDKKKFSFCHFVILSFWNIMHSLSLWNEWRLERECKMERAIRTSTTEKEGEIGEEKEESGKETETKSMDILDIETMSKCKRTSKENGTGIEERRIGG